MENREIVVHGGGYCGLTIAVHYALAGCKVIIYDPDRKTVDSVNSGVPRVREYLDYINENVKTLIDAGLLSATTDFNLVKNRPIHLLDVPTEKGDEPYLEIVKASIETLEECIPDDGVIIVESTLQPGTIDSLYLPRVRQGVIHLAVAFRSDWFADVEKNVTNLPRWVGGTTPKATQKAKDIVSIICKDVRETNHCAAEVGKAAQNSLYFVQVAAAYQLAKSYQQFVDANEVLRIVSSHWRLPNLYLGPGTSGRCVAMGAKYICAGAPANRAPAIFKQAIYDDHRWREMLADLMVAKLNVADSLKKRILIMGVAYRPNFSDFGYSASLGIAEYLNKAQWNVYVHDAILDDSVIGNATKVPALLRDERIPTQEFDVILLATAHDPYLGLPEIQHAWRKDQLVIDATGAWERYRLSFQSLGVTYVRVGEQGWIDKLKEERTWV